METFKCTECGNTKTAINTTLKKVCCAKCRSFIPKQSKKKLQASN